MNNFHCHCHCHFRARNLNVLVIAKNDCDIQSVITKFPKIFVIIHHIGELCSMFNIVVPGKSLALCEKTKKTCRRRSIRTGILNHQFEFIYV